MKLYNFIATILIIGALCTSSLFCMKEDANNTNESNEHHKNIIHKPGFRELLNNSEDNENKDDRSDESSDEDIDDEIYEKRHKNYEDQEKKRNKKQIANEKQKRSRWEKKSQEYAKLNRCDCFVTNKDSIQCISCEQWHMIPKEFIKKFNETNPFTCFNTTWDSHMSKKCSEEPCKIQDDI